MAYGQNFNTFNNGVGWVNRGRQLYNAGNWLNTQFGGAAAAPEGGAAAGASGAAAPQAGTTFGAPAAAAPEFAGAGVGAGAEAAGTAALGTEAAAAAGGAAATDAAATAAATAVAAGATEAAAGAGGAALAAELAPLAVLAFSDKRVKTDISTVGRLQNGLLVHQYRLKSGGPVQIGLLAQEVQKVHPEAVHKGPQGILMVDYSAATKPVKS